MWGFARSRSAAIYSCIKFSILKIKYMNKLQPRDGDLMSETLARSILLQVFKSHAKSGLSYLVDIFLYFTLKASNFATSSLVQAPGQGY